MKPYQSIFVCLILISLSISNTAQTLGAETDILMKALEDEMSRSLNQLQLKEFGKPYFVEYGVNDEETYSLSAKFGAIQNSSFDHLRNASIQIRIGNYDFDNTNLFTSGTLSSMIPLSLDDNYDSFRHDLWLGTDAVYKSAIEQFSSKKAFLQNNVVEEKLPDFSKENPIVAIREKQKLQIDSVKWEKFIRQLSAVFRRYPEITDSTVSMLVSLNNRYLVNSEGTRLRDPNLLIALNIYAETITSDNLKITPSRHIYARSFDKLPSFEEINQTVELLAQDLTKLRHAPILEETYIGPVLFTDRAAVQLFSQLFAPNLSVVRSTLARQSSDGGVFGERINRRVLPPSVSAIDDPTRLEINGYPLIGSYQFDFQGVPAKPLKIVENGILKTLLTNRAPTKSFPNSNGRARSTSGSPFISNLLIQASDGKNFSELKQDLINSCRAQSLPFGIMLTEIDTTFFSVGRSLTAPILAYKVYVEDGRQELIRNLSIDDFPIRELRQFLGIGNDQFTLNHLNGNGQRGNGTPYSITAPSVLMDEIVLRKDTSSKSKPLILSHPYFVKEN